MATILSTLYPPLVDTFQIPFLYTQDAEIYFTISPYNSYGEIKHLHITLVNQKTNQNVFALSNPRSNYDGTVLTNGVWIIPFTLGNNSFLTGDHTKNYYKLKIPSYLLRQLNEDEPSYTCDCYYKVQIRFDKYELKENEKIDNLYLTNKRAYFSEWSAVTLLKAIPEIEVKLTNFDTDFEIMSKKIPQYTPGIIPITGVVSFIPPNNTQTTEHLESFKVEIIDNNGNLIKDSGIQFVEENTNTFNWLCDLTNGIINTKYDLNLYLTTNNHYTFEKRYSFKLIDLSILDFNPIWNFNKITLPYTEDNKQILVTSEDGWVTINITVSNILPAGYLFIKRASSLDKYLNWEIIDCTYFADGSHVSTTFIDKTIGSLVNYKYSCQYLTLGGLWSKTVKTNEIVYPDFHDILILRGDKQLAIRYNAQISSMTPVVNRIKIDTLGGKYPRFAQNAQMHYKQFQLTGIISAEEDYNRKFISDLDYAEEMNIYNEQMNGKYIIRNDKMINRQSDISNYISEIEQYDWENIDKPYNKSRKSMLDTQNNTNHDIYPIDNWWWERKFREEVIEWLNDGEPKLYRSMTEGNLLVMFDAVSLTPNAQLSRRIWNFSATVYEVGDGYSLTDLSTLGIFSIKNDFNTNIYLKRRDENSQLNEKVWVGQKNHYIASSRQTDFVKSVNNNFKTIVQNNSSENQYIVNCKSLLDEINDAYNSVYENYKIDENSIYLTDVKIYFESSPKWYDLTSMNLKENNNLDLNISIGDTKYNFKYDSDLHQYILVTSEE